MKRFCMILLMALIYTGCTTMPAPVKDQYLAEKSPEENEKLQKIEDAIIVKNREKQQSEKNLKQALPVVATTKEEIELLNKEEEILSEQLELYTKAKDAVNIEQKNNQLTEIRSKLETKKALLEFQTAESEYLSADNELKKAQLAALISELNYEKSKIAKAYREKNEPDTSKEGNAILNFFKKTDPNDRFEYKKYKVYHEKMKKELIVAEQKFKKSEEKYASAKDKFETVK